MTDLPHAGSVEMPEALEEVMLQHLPSVHFEVPGRRSKPPRRTRHSVQRGAWGKSQGRRGRAARRAPPGCCKTQLGACHSGPKYPVVIITCVHYLGPPGPFSFPDSRDLLEVLGGLSWQREERGGVPRGSSRTLGDPPWGLSLCQRKSS